MGTHKIPLIKETRKDIPIMPPDLALLSTLIGSNYPCLELIFMVPKVFEPLKFYCICLKPKVLSASTKLKPKCGVKISLGSKMKLISSLVISIYLSASESWT